MTSNTVQSRSNIYNRIYYSTGMPNHVGEWSGSDTPHNARPEWDIKFDYRYNSLGFRGKEPVPNTPCLISFGCSITEGIGIPEHMRFGDIVADELNLTHYSFARGGSDMSEVLNNIHQFFHSHADILDVRKMIILWPDLSRFPRLVDNNGIHTTVSYSHTVNGWEEDFIVHWDRYVSPIFLANIMRMVEVLCKNKDIQLAQTCNGMMFDLGDTPSFISKKEYSRNHCDFGRDHHPGPNSHRYIADVFIKKLTSD